MSSNMMGMPGLLVRTVSLLYTEARCRLCVQMRTAKLGRDQPFAGYILSLSAR